MMRVAGLLAAAAGLAAACLGQSGGSEPSPVDLEWLRQEAGDGALAHHADGRLYLTELSTGRSVYIGPGNQPEFSPDSSKLAWIEGTRARGRMRKGDSTVHVIAENVVPEGGVHWVTDREVAVVLNRRGRRAWHRVSLAGEMEEIPELTQLGTGGYECDVRLGGDGVWSYIADQSWATSDGRSGRVPGTCSVSLSPDGRSATSLHNPHLKAPITAIRPGGIERVLTWRYKGTFDNHRWSSNDRRFITAVDEHFQTMVVMRADLSRLTRLGTLGRAEHGMYADFTVGPGEGKPWPSRPRASGAWPPQADSLAFLWVDGRSANAIADGSGPRRLCRLVPEDSAHLDRHFAMSLRGGTCRTDPATDARLAKKFAQSGRFTLQALLHPSGAASQGRIVAWENGFSLHQVDARLSLRMGGDMGEADLGAIPAEPFHLAIAYAPGRLRAWVDGRIRLVNRQASGNLREWRGGRLIWGPWAGGIEGIAIHTRELAAEEILESRKAYLPRLRQRVPLPRIQVEAELVHKPKLPPAEAYPQSLVVYRYRLLKTLRGEAPQEPLAVVHRGILNGRLQPVSRRAVGQRFRMLLEPFAKHGELQGLRKVDDGATNPGILYFEVEGGDSW